MAPKKPLRQELSRQTASYIVGALGLVAGLAWNEAIKQFIESYFPLEENSLLAKFIYAIAMTVLVVILTHFLLSTNDET